MTVHKGATGVERNGGSVRGATAIVLCLWVLLILAQLGFFYAIHEETSKLILKSSDSSTVPRKMRFLATQYSSQSSLMIHDPPSKVVKSSTTTTTSLPSSSMNNIEGDPADTVYGDDKRIIHTGPNPLHN